MKLFDNSLPLQQKSTSILSIKDILTKSYGLRIHNNMLYYVDLPLMTCTEMLNRYKDNFSESHRGLFRIIFAEKFEAKYGMTFLFSQYALIDDAESVEDIYKQLTA